MYMKKRQPAGKPKPHGRCGLCGEEKRPIYGAVGGRIVLLQLLCRCCDPLGIAVERATEET